LRVEIKNQAINEQAPCGASVPKEKDRSLLGWDRQWAGLAGEMLPCSLKPLQSTRQTKVSVEVSLDFPQRLPERASLDPSLNSGAFNLIFCFQFLVSRRICRVFHTAGEIITDGLCHGLSVSKKSTKRAGAMRKSTLQRYYSATKN
jgi:hypothetical protein